MSLRNDFAAKLDCIDPIGSAAILLLAYERGDEGLDIRSLRVQSRLKELAEMTDEDFDTEHRRVVDEKHRKESFKRN